MSSPGDVCRQALIENWVVSNPNSTQIMSLLALQETPMFADITAGCQEYIIAFNAAAGITCLLQNATPGITYSDFWQIGAANMDAHWSLALDMLYSANFTEISAVIPCANSCYSKSNGVPGCEIGQSFLSESNFGKIPQDRVCAMKWSGLDEAYNQLRLCAAELVGNPINGTKEDLVVAYQNQTDSQRECSKQACESLDTTTPPSTSTATVPMPQPLMLFLTFSVIILLLRL